MRRQLLSVSRRRALQCGATLLGAGAGLPIAAGQAAGPVSAQPLRLVGPWEIGGLAPAQTGYLFQRLGVLETLLETGPEGQPRPGLAQRWQVSADGRLWQFWLAPGRRFHDGTPLLAERVLPSLRLAQRAPALLARAPIQAMTATGPLTLQIHLREPYAGLAALLAHASTAVLSPAGLSARGVLQVIGTGPYQLEQLQPPQHLSLRAFAQHPGPPPAVQRIRYLAAGRAETRALMAWSGQADMAFALDPASVQRARAGAAQGAVQLASVTLPRTIMLKLNAGLPRLADRRVRQALSLAIDRPGIARALLREPDLAATQLLPPSLSAWHDPSLPPLHQDLARARALLREAGWTQEGAGWRDRQGLPVSLTLRTFPDRPELPLVATALQEQWRQLGLPVRVAIGNSGDIPLAHRQGTLEIGLAARHYATAPDPAVNLAQDFGPQGGDWGAMGWHSPALSQALAQLLREGAQGPQAQALRRQVCTVLQEELPVIPIAWYRLHVAVGERLRPPPLDPLERRYDLQDLQWSGR